MWGTSERLVPAKTKQNAWYQRVLRCQLRGRPFHPWAGRLRFTGEAHPGPATLTQSSTSSCGAGLRSESRLLLCCAPAVYMLAADAAVAAAVFGLEHLISYCNHTERCFGPTSRGLGRLLCHGMPNCRAGEENPKQQLPLCCRCPCEGRDCCPTVAMPSGSELPSSLQYVHNTSPNKSTAVIVNDHNADGTTCAERPRHSPMTGLCDDLAILTTARVRLLVDSFVEGGSYVIFLDSNIEHRTSGIIM